MIQIAFYDTRPYDRVWFDRLNAGTYRIKYFESKLNEDSAKLARGCQAAVAFVNDQIDAAAITALAQEGVQIIAMRSAGYNNVDFQAAYDKKMTVVNVPGYSPYAVAEHAMALLLTLNRKTHRAYLRTRDYNFNLNGLTGFDLHGKTAGVIGTGRIGQVFINICRGFGMNVVAYDLFPNPTLDVDYVSLDQLLEQSDVISLHCPLTNETRHIINADSLNKMKPSAVLINTSRGALIDSEALLQALKEEKIAGAGLDVYEEESELFYEDNSNENLHDDVLALLISMRNVIVTSHQAFLTDEALHNIAETTLQNLDDFFSGAPLKNEICYFCVPGGKKAANCPRLVTGRCF